MPHSVKNGPRSSVVQIGHTRSSSKYLGSREFETASSLASKRQAICLAKSRV
jgi:hypothetical protein